MEVDIVRSSPQARIYLQQMKDFPGKDRFDLALPARMGRREWEDIVQRSGKRSVRRVFYTLKRILVSADEACKPRLSNGVATFRLPLLEQDMLRCGITRVVNKVTVRHNYEPPMADRTRHSRIIKTTE